MAYETEEQQVEALKKWWSENGNYLVAGVVLGLGILFGWNSWKDNRETQAQVASEVFAQLTVAVESSSFDEAKALDAKLTQDYDGTPYAALGSLAMARVYVEQDNLAEAEARLRWTIDHARQQELREVARLRLAQVLIAEEKYADALTMLATELPPAYISLIEELRGDALRAQGKLAEARAAYDKALLTAGGRAEYLQLKRDAVSADPETVS